MKITPHCLFTLLFASASIHAMDNIKIEPFNLKTDSNAAIQIHRSAFPKACTPFALRRVCRDQTTHVISRYNDQDSDPRLLGLVIHYSLISDKPEYLTQNFDYMYTQLPQSYNILNIDILAIKPEEQRQGYGELLINHIATKEHDFISLTSTQSARPFYKKIGFLETCTQYSKHGLMVKPLNAQAMDTFTSVNPSSMDS